MWQGWGQSFDDTMYDAWQAINGGVTENCMILSHDYGYQWDDADCAITSLFYICEKAASC